ncbi:thiamine-phosphate diphosphorylase [Thermoplasmatales archaeon SG8-52-2]|nr:MAG: thiamine-phosphate diphosphorylase [Thermoplasmatales archaeon SG8-52-2]
MLNKLGNIDFYMITDSNLSKNGIVTDVSNAVDAGCKIVQYREKCKSTKDMIKEAKKLKKICNDKAIFLINDRIDVALAVDADGVHIGQDDMDIKTVRRILGNDKIIGLTIHNLEEALEAKKLGLDYIGVAPIFQTDTKKDALKPCGVEMIKKIREKVELPIVAVGGIDKQNLKDVICAGADSAVSINTVLASNDVYSEIKDFIRIIGECK